MTPVRIVVTIAVFLGAVCMLAMVLLLPRPAHAQVPPPVVIPKCASLALMTRILREAAKEFVVASGTASDGRAIHLTASAAGTWTIIATSPAGIACIRVYGTNLEMPRS